MKRTLRCAWLATLALALCATAQVPTPPPDSTGATKPIAGDVASPLARWTELLLLDLPGEVLREGRPLVEAGGPLCKDARAVALLARALATSGLAQDAQRLLDSRADAAPIEFLVAERARLALEADDLERVLALLWDSKARELRKPATNEAWMIAARARVRRAEWDQAVPLLERYLALEPRSADAAGAWHLLAVEASRRQDAARARECAEREEALGRWHAYYRARLLQVRENPREPLPRLGLAQLWLEAGEVSRARVVLEELLRIAPGFAQGWMALGETQRKQNDLTGARACYDAALKLDPALDIARYNRAVIARLEARDDEARSDLEILLAGNAGRDPRFAGAHLDLARLYAKSKDDERAAACFARYRELGGKEKL